MSSPFFTTIKISKEMYKHYLIAIVFIVASLKVNAQILIPDSLYGTNSATAFSSPFGETFIKFLLQTDGKIISAGYDYDSNTNSFHIDMFRHDQCGELDSAFGVNGLSRITFEQRNTGYGFTLQPDGKIISVGIQAPSNSGSQQIPYVARFNADGNPDTTFGTGGSNSLRFDATSSGAFYSPHVLSDGRIVCMGNSSGNINGGVNAVGLMRFNADGTLDLTFDGDGKVQKSGIGLFYSELNGYIVNDRYIVGGLATDGSFLQHFFAVAFDTTGAVDTTWASNGIFNYPINLSGGICSFKQSDGKILLGAQKDPATDGIGVIRINPDGTLDSTFAQSGLMSIVNTSLTVKRIKELSTGKILVMGISSLGFGMGFGYQLNNDGSTDTLFGASGLMNFDLNGNTGTHSLMDVLELQGGRLLAGGSASDMISKRYIEMSNVPYISLNNMLLSSTGNGTFQWYRDSVLLPGATNATHDPLLPGNYQVELTDDIGCTYLSAPFEILSAGVTSNGSAEFNIYPNPFMGRIIITDINEPAQVTILDVSGKVIADYTFTSSGIKELNTEYILPGSYLCRINTDRVSIIKRLIKVE